MTVKAKRFRIGVEGATTDGREIQREWLEQMAASYNPAVYTALINLEHIKSYLPDSTFTWWGRMKTCWYLIALMPTGATLNGQRKCSGNACNVALRHSRYNWRKGGQISTRKCL